MYATCQIESNTELLLDFLHAKAKYRAFYLIPVMKLLNLFACLTNNEKEKKCIK